MFPLTTETQEKPIKKQIYFVYNIHHSRQLSERGENIYINIIYNLTINQMISNYYVNVFIFCTEYLSLRLFSLWMFTL